MNAMTPPLSSPESQPATRTGAQLVVDTLAALGRSGLFLVNVLFGRARFGNGWTLLVKQLHAVGVLSLAIVLVQARRCEQRLRERPYMPAPAISHRRESSYSSCAPAAERAAARTSRMPVAPP